MKLYDVVILTEDKYVDPKNIDWYIDNLLKEDRLLTEALEKLGCRVIRKSWSDPNFDWSSTKSCIFRTTWDYHERYEEFSNWLEENSGKMHFINPIETIKWNIDKHYLKDLAQQDIRIPPTLFIEQGYNTNLSKLFEQSGWEEAILKPVVSGAARHTYKLNAENIAEYESIFQKVISTESMMLQAFQKRISTDGEMSLMIFGGKYSHAVLKKAKQGDFRVQDDFGGTVSDYTPTDEEIKFAEKAVMACSPLPVYARADIFHDNDNQLALGEIELIEPELWFRNNEEAAHLAADAIKKTIDQL